MSETQNNIIRFNYSVDPTTLMSNSWITTNTDTDRNTVTPEGECYWRTITFNFTGKEPFSGVFRIKVDENGIPDTSVFESISGGSVIDVYYSEGTLYVNGSIAKMSNFSTSIENTTYTETEPAGTWSYVQSDYGITHYWRTITVSDTSYPSGSGVIKIEVNENGVPLTDGQDISNYSVLSGYSDIIALMYYGDKLDRLVFIGPDKTYTACMSDFSVSSENTTLQLDNTQGDAGTWSYVASTTTEPVYDHYEVELYVNSDVTTFPNNLFYDDSHITSIEFNTYSITSIEDGVDKSSGAFCECPNLASITLPDNLEYIGNNAIFDNAITSIILPETLEEIGSNGLRIYNVSITSLATVPPTLNAQSLPDSYTLTIHEASLQSYINSDWAENLTIISTIETPTYNNVLKFNYSEDPTTLLNNLWVNSCTDTSENTIVPVGEHTEPGYMSLNELGELTKNWTEEQTLSGVQKNEEIARVGGLSPYLISVGWTSEEVNEFMSIYDENSSTAYVICYIETNSEDYDDIMSFIETEVIVYDHYEVTLYINSALNTFETTMFTDDDNITSVEFDYDVTSIIDDAFNGCENLSSVTLTSTVPPTIGEDTFSLISPDAVLYVPTASIPAYQTAGFGDYFGEIRGTSPVPPKRSGFNVSGMIDTDFIIEVYKRR